MVLCLIAFPVFAILSVFSAKYRKLAMESLECIFRTATLRKCRSGLDERLKSSLAGKTMRVSPRLAGFIYNNYKILSWVVLIIFLWSLYGISVGFYNYARYGNCNGPEETGFCVFDPAGANSKISEIDAGIQSEIVYPSVDTDDPIIGPLNAQLTIIEFGCYACPYTKKAELTVKEVVDYYKGKVNLQFKTFYIPHHNLSYYSALASNCALEQGAYIEYHNALLSNQEKLSYDYLIDAASSIGMNSSQFETCLRTEKYKDEVNSDTLEGIHAGVIGTPTFFINRQKIVGPKPPRTFKSIINNELK